MRDGLLSPSRVLFFCVCLSPPLHPHSAVAQSSLSPAQSSLYFRPPFPSAVRSPHALAFIFLPSQSCRRRRRGEERRGSGSPSLPPSARLGPCLFFPSEWTRQTKYCQTGGRSPWVEEGCPAATRTDLLLLVLV